MFYPSTLLCAVSVGAHLKPLLKLLILLLLFIKSKVEKQEEETSHRKGTM